MEEFEIWKNGFLNEINQDELNYFKALLENTDNPEDFEQIQRIKAFDDYFEKKDALRWEYGLDIEASEKKHLKNYFKLLDQGLNIDQALAQSTKKPLFKKQWSGFLLGTLGGAAATLSLVALFNFGNNTKKTIKATPNTWDNFKSNGMLDNLIKDNGTMGETASLNMISPLPSGEYSEKIIFHWNYSGHDDLELELLNNKNMSLTDGIRIILPKNVQQLELNLSGLEPGLYYWKITRKSDLLLLNKFTVKEF